MQSDLIKIDPANLLACPDCDILLQKNHLKPGSKACCPRCGHILHVPVKDSVEKALVCSLTGLLLFLPAIFLPIMTLDTMGLEQAGSIYDAIIVVYGSGYRFVAFMVALTSIIFPLVKFLLIFFIAFNLRIKRYPESLPKLMRCYKHIDEWGMLEVFMVGILVAIIKLHHMAHIHYDFGFACFVALLIMAMYASVTMDEHEFWDRIENKPLC
jgi:paraquat-inducible protein A